MLPGIKNFFLLSITFLMLVIPFNCKQQREKAGTGTEEIHKNSEIFPVLKGPYLGQNRQEQPLKFLHLILCQLKWTKLIPSLHLMEKSFIFLKIPKEIVLQPGKVI